MFLIKLNSYFEMFKRFANTGLETLINAIRYHFMKYHNVLMKHIEYRDQFCVCFSYLYYSDDAIS